MKTRYSPLNQLMHWVTALCMFSILPLAWVMVNSKPGSSLQHGAYNWHKTLGCIVFLVTLFRIVWRFIDPPPAYPPKVAAWDRHLAHLVYFLFFAIMIWMPLTGFIESAYDGYPIALFNVIQTPEIFPKDQHMEDLFAWLHRLGIWPTYGLIILHLVGVVFHVVWGKDGVLGRMLPEDALDTSVR